MTVVVVAAHPDDVELLCAGTLARLSQAGTVVNLAHLTYGDKGGREDPQELARTREREAQAAAALIGARVDGRICGDLELYATDEFGEQVADLLTPALDVTAILTHHPGDYHPDHRITSELVLQEASGRSLLSKVWFMDSVGGAHFIPTHLVDITSTIEVKKRMLRCHESQMAWMSAARHADRAMRPVRSAPPRRSPSITGGCASSSGRSRGGTSSTRRCSRSTSVGSRGRRGPSATPTVSMIS